MPGKNSGVCHGCRSVGHFFSDCPIKRRCPLCAHGFQKFFEVEKDTVNKSKFFKCCSVKCGFWDWRKDGEVNGESSGIRPKPLADEEVEDMSRKFQSQVQLNNEEELLITVTVNVTVRRA